MKVKNGPGIGSHRKALKVWFSPSDYARVFEMARREGTTVSQMVREYALSKVGKNQETAAVAQ